MVVVPSDFNFDTPAANNSAGATTDLNCAFDLAESLSPSAAYSADGFSSGLLQGNSNHRERKVARENLSNGVTPGTSALALGDLVRLHGILGCLVVSKFFCPHIVFTDVQGTEQVGHSCDHSRRARDIEDRSVESG
jgi:hypothetical protein